MTAVRPRLGARARTWQHHTRQLPAAETLQFAVNGQVLNLRDNLDDLLLHFSQCPPNVFLQAGFRALFSKQNVGRGLALRRSQWEFDNFPAVELPEKLSWAENPLGDRNWQWQLHSFAMLPALLAAHHETGDVWFLERGATLVAGWIEDNIGATPPCEFSWHDHATALRLESWLYWFEYMRGRGLDGRLLALFLTAVDVHARVLSEPHFYTANTNHGFSQALTLFLAGGTLRELPQAGPWQQLGLERMRAEVSFAFASDGVHVENSPAYHVQILQSALQADQACRAFIGRALSETWEMLIAAAMDFAAFVTKPDGNLPPVGDSRVVSLSKVIQAIENIGVMPSGTMLFAATQGKDGAPPAEVDRVFPVSGYAIFRDAWHTAADFDQGVYLLFKAGFLSTYHRHDDDLSFILYAYGEDWLIDAGLYRYAEQDPLRQYVRSSQAHNVVMVDGLAATRRVTSLRHARLEKYWLQDQLASVTGSHELYPGFRTQRRIDYFKPERFVIHDSVVATDGQAHGFRLLFHVPADKAIEVAGSEILISSQQTSRRLRLTFPADLFEVQVVAGQGEPDYQGWRSRKYGQIEGAKCIMLAVSATGGLASTVELTFC